MKILLALVLATAITLVVAVVSDNSELIADLTLKLYKGLRKPGEDENILISGWSVQLTMAMVYLGANGSTASQIANAANFGTVPNIHQIEKELLDYYRVDETNYTVDVENRIYAQDNFAPAISNSYKTNITNYYGSAFEEFQFVDSASTAKRVNDWVTNVTNKTLNNFFSPTSFDQQAVMIIENAIYFRGLWARPFNVRNTVNRTFTLDNGTSITTQFMQILNRRFGYRRLRSLEATALVLPYAGNDIKMVLLITDDKVKVNQILDKLNAKTLLEIPKKTTNRMFSLLEIPKFKLETTYANDLRASLQKLGITDVFDNKLSDLSGITSATPLYVSNLQHKAVIEIDEGGTKSAAGTGGPMLPPGDQPVPHNPFKARRPFAFYILDSRSDTILFFGVYNKPPN